MQGKHTRKTAPVSRLIGYARVSASNKAPIRSSTSCALPAALRCTRSTPPAPIAPDRCWRACCVRSAPARPWSWFARPPRLFGQPPARRHRTARGPRRAACPIPSSGCRLIARRPLELGDGARHLQREHALRWWCRSDTHAKMTPIFPLCGRNSAPTGGRLMTDRRFMRCGWRRAL